MSTFSWLDSDRFPGRGHLQSLARSHRPERSAARPMDALDHSLRHRWAKHLGVQGDDLLPCASASDAWRLLCSATMLPGDVALLAQPCDTALPAAVLSTGASWLDLSRDGEGAIDATAVTRAAELHPGAILLAESPSLFGGDDTAIEAGSSGLRAMLADARHGPGLAGEGALVERAEATVIALRDPDDPAAPALHAIVCRPGSGPMLRAIQGSDPLPEALLEQGLAHLAVLARLGSSAATSWRNDLAASRQRFVELVTAHPGAVIFAGQGTRAAVECRAGDAAVVAGTLMAAHLSVSAGNAHPMRNLVVCDLAASAAMG